VVKIFAFLDLEQISADFEIERFETGSFDLVFKLTVDGLVNNQNHVTPAKAGVHNSLK